MQETCSSARRAPRPSPAGHGSRKPEGRADFPAHRHRLGGQTGSSTSRSRISQVFVASIPLSPRSARQPAGLQAEAGGRANGCGTANTGGACEAVGRAVGGQPAPQSDARQVEEIANGVLGRPVPAELQEQNLPTGSGRTGSRRTGSGPAGAQDRYSTFAYSICTRTISSRARKKASSTSGSKWPPRPSSRIAKHFSSGNAGL